MIQPVIENIVVKLRDNYYSYYESVSTYRIREAVQSTLDDFSRNAIYNYKIEDIHNHIKDSYI